LTSAETPADRLVGRLSDDDLFGNAGGDRLLGELGDDDLEAATAPTVAIRGLEQAWSSTARRS
jgi:hypothetical protein